MDDYERLCDALGWCDAPGHYPDVDTGIGAIKQLERDSADNAYIRCLRELDEWSEDVGDVLWWKLPVSEAPYVGSPLFDDFPDYVTHWTPIPIPFGCDAY